MTGGAAGTGAPPTGLRALLDAAIELYAERPAEADRLRARRERLDGPLRVALVGRVKAGKSTLLNALVGARVAPTDAGECTRVVTTYRHGAVPRVTRLDADGTARRLPVHRVAGGLELDLAGAAPQEVDQLVVDWPAPDLEPVTLVDTPGTSSLSVDTSARTHAFLDEEDRMPGADAIVYLTRQLQPDDVSFLAAFQSRSGAGGSSATTITVLSRADEIGSGRLDALHAADEVAHRMSGDPAVQAVSSAVLPVAGLLALAGRTLRHGEFVALRSLAHAPPADVESMLLSADRFCRAQAPVPVSATVRAALLERLGMFGVRLSIALVRAGMPDARALAEELVHRSGLAQLQAHIAERFTERSELLTAEAALRTVEAVLRATPLPGDDALWRELERLRLAAHAPVELALVAASEEDGVLPAELRTEARRLLGAHGGSPATRLGLVDHASEQELRSVAVETITRWQARGADPLAPRATRDAIAVVVHSCEAVLAELDGPRSGLPGAQPGAGGPGPEGDQTEGDQPRLGDERDPVDPSAPGDQALRHVHREQRQHARDQERPARP
ncbi:dynamin family protein [Blastococcus tunisiensis]|uniref:Dynamin family protein n=1 Tax=Blastococcus tunisiensis TaxID=1798228 RepID=A0A1I2FIT5_9ACTN|nr:dynamin family protein [Blastococcus sp. DSM 46838]SFF04530.1 Dynamin family protein [Blastococcus sp. DSM 46838]